MALKEVSTDTFPFDSVRKVVWTTLANGDNGRGVKVWGPRLSMAYTGTFGVGGSIQLEVSNDSTDGSDGTWFLKNDIANASTAKTASAIVVALLQEVWVRPRVTAGDGTTALVATLASRP